MTRPAHRPPRDDQSATSWLQVRVTPRRKAAYVRAARPGKLSAWVQRVLDGAAGYLAEQQSKSIK